MTPAAASSSAPVFEAAAVSKTYPGVRALEGVTLTGYPGEVLAICGANGAKPSTHDQPFVFTKVAGIGCDNIGEFYDPDSAF